MKVSTTYKGCPYITPGKEYEVIAQDGKMITIIDDEGDKILSIIDDDIHLDGQAWEVINDKEDLPYIEPAGLYDPGIDEIRSLQKQLKACEQSHADYERKLDEAIKVIEAEAPTSKASRTFLKSLESDDD